MRHSYSCSFSYTSGNQCLRFQILGALIRSPDITPGDSSQLPDSPQLQPPRRRFPAPPKDPRMLFARCSLHSFSHCGPSGGVGTRTTCLRSLSSCPLPSVHVFRWSSVDSVRRRCRILIIRHHTSSSATWTGAIQVPDCIDELPISGGMPGFSLTFVARRLELTRRRGVFSILLFWQV